MTRRFAALALGVCLLAGCNYVDGSYYPGCVAFAGDKVRLAEGRFVWDKFTDQVIVDDDGTAVDQFPAYPRQGTYELKGQTLQMRFDDGEAQTTMHLVRQDDRVVLLTQAQFDDWEATGRHDDCALTREGDGVR